MTSSLQPVGMALAASAIAAGGLFAAAAQTGSAAMLAATVHALVATFCLGLLRTGLGLGGARHPALAALVAPVLLHALGAGVAIHEGILRLGEAALPAVASGGPAALGLALLCYAIASLTAHRNFIEARRDVPPPLTLDRGDPAAFAMLVVSAAGLLGIVVTVVGLAAAVYLDWTIADALAAVAVGIVLGAVAALMALAVSQRLPGAAASPELRASGEAILRNEIANGPLRGFGKLETMRLGPGEVLVAVELDFRDGATAPTVEATVRRLEARIRTYHPEVRRLYLAVPAPVAKVVRDDLARVGAGAVEVEGAMGAVAGRASTDATKADSPPASRPPPASGSGKSKKRR